MADPRRPNPKIDFEETPFFVNAAPRAWTNGSGPRRAGVSSFGVGGTNAHVVLEAYPGPDRPRPGGRELYILSAKTGPALERKRRELADYLEARPDLHPADVAGTLMLGRDAFTHRWCGVHADIEELIRALRTPGSGRTAVVDARARPRTVFLLPDREAPDLRALRSLLEAHPRFRKEVNAWIETAASMGDDMDLPRLLFRDGEARADADGSDLPPSVGACLTFIVSHALALLLRSWGVVPRAMLGAGVGECAAAALSGVFRPRDALTLVRRREEIRGGAPGRPVNDDAARDEFARAVRAARPSPPDAPYISSLTGRRISREEVVDPAWWAGLMDSRPKLPDGVGELLKNEVVHFIELGSGGGMSDGVMRHPFFQPACSAMPFLRGAGETKTDGRGVLESLGALWTSGASMDWKAFGALSRGGRISLPTYPFEPRRYWKLMENFENRNR